MNSREGVVLGSVGQAQEIRSQAVVAAVVGRELVVEKVQQAFVPAKKLDRTMGMENVKKAHESASGFLALVDERANLVLVDRAHRVYEAPDSVPLGVVQNTWRNEQTITYVAPRVIFIFRGVFEKYRSNESERDPKPGIVNPDGVLDRNGVHPEYYTPDDVQENCYEGSYDLHSVRSRAMRGVRRMSVSRRAVTAGFYTWLDWTRPSHTRPPRKLDTRPKRCRTQSHMCRFDTSEQ